MAISATRYMGIPVVPGGRSRAGVDCWGLVRLVYKEERGIDLPAYDGVDWSRSAEVWEAIAKTEADGEWLPIVKEDRLPFDVVVLRIKGTPWHIGVLLNRDQFMHADPVRGICVERVESLHWRNRVEQVLRLKDDCGAGTF